MNVSELDSLRAEIISQLRTQGRHDPSADPDALQKLRESQIPSIRDLAQSPLIMADTGQTGILSLRPEESVARAFIDDLAKRVSLSRFLYAEHLRPEDETFRIVLRWLTESVYQSADRASLRRSLENGPRRGNKVLSSLDADYWYNCAGPVLGSFVSRLLTKSANVKRLHGEVSAKWEASPEFGWVLKLVSAGSRRLAGLGERSKTSGP